MSRKMVSLNWILIIVGVDNLNNALLLLSCDLCIFTVTWSWVYYVLIGLSIAMSKNSWIEDTESGVAR